MFTFAVLFTLMLNFVPLETLITDWLTPETCALPDWYMQVDSVSDEGKRHFRTGDEYILMGIVRSEATCAPLANTKIYFDMANDAGDYDGVHQGIIYTNKLGLFVIISDRPAPYGGGEAHIHLFLGADGHAPITIGHNLTGDADVAWTDITLPAGS